MEWVNIIISSIATLVGLIGGGIGIVFWRENKALKAEEARLKAEEVNKSAIENELKQAEAWQQLFESERSRNKEKSDRLRDLYTTLDDHKEQIRRLEFECERRNWYRCTVEGCPKRRPPHQYDDLGNEIAAPDPIKQ